MIAESRQQILARDDLGRPIYAYNDKGKPVCGAQRLDGTYCRSVARFPNGRCKIHGGPMSKKNADQLPVFRAGLYTSSLPQRYRLMFQRMLDNPDMLNLKVDIALQDVRMQTLVEQLEHGYTKELWEEFQEELEGLLSRTNFERAYSEPEYAALKLQEIEDSLRKIERITEQAVDEDKTWDQIGEVSKTRERLVTSESNRLSKERGVMPAEQVFQLFMLVMESVRKNVKSRTEKIAIARDIEKMSILPQNRLALGGKPGIEGSLVPSAETSDMLLDVEDTIEE